MSRSPFWGEAPPAVTPRSYITLRRPKHPQDHCVFLGKLVWTKLHWPTGYDNSIPCLGEQCPHCKAPPFDYGYAPGAWWPGNVRKPDVEKCIIGVSPDAYADLLVNVGEDYLKRILRYYPRHRDDKVITHHFDFVREASERLPFYYFDVRPLMIRMWSRLEQKANRALFTDHIPGVGDPANDPAEVRAEILRQAQQLGDNKQIDEPRRTIQ